MNSFKLPLRFDPDECQAHLAEEYVRKGMPMANFRFNGPQAKRFVLTEFGQQTLVTGEVAEITEEMEEGDVEEEIDDDLGYHLQTQFVGGEWQVQKVATSGERAGETIMIVSLPPITSEGQGFYVVDTLDDGTPYATQNPAAQEYFSLVEMTGSDDPFGEDPGESSTALSAPGHAAQSTLLPGMGRPAGKCCAPGV